VYLTTNNSTVKRKILIDRLIKEGHNIKYKLMQMFGAGIAQKRTPFQPLKS
jgi:hypothetical protein